MRAEALALAPAEHAFGPLAARHSDDQATRYQGGVAGWVARGGGARWDAAVVDASFALARPGEVSPLVRTADGLYLLKLIDRRPAALRPLREVREAIRHELVTARRAEIEARFRRDMRAATEVWIDTDRLDGLELPEAALTREGVPTPPPLPGS
jgi:parvulin-like peptidyl-prolyl isomerase